MRLITELLRQAHFAGVFASVHTRSLSAVAVAPAAWARLPCAYYPAKGTNRDLVSYKKLACRFESCLLRLAVKKFANTFDFIYNHTRADAQLVVFIAL